MRFGETTQRAWKQYCCDQCHHPIAIGALYERSVWIPSPNTVYAMRIHVSPGCPEEEELSQAAITVLDEIATECVPLRLAA